jgi:hypothetical protein
MSDIQQSTVPNFINKWCKSNLEAHNWHEAHHISTLKMTAKDAVEQRYKSAGLCQKKPFIAQFPRKPQRSFETLSSL